MDTSPFGITMGVLWTVLAGMTVVAFVAAVMYFDGQVPGPGQPANVQMACVPTDHTYAAISLNNAPDQELTVTSLTIVVERTGNFVTVTASSELSAGLLAITQNVVATTGSWIDSRCIPPSISFANCSETCISDTDGCSLPTTDSSAHGLFGCDSTLPVSFFASVPAFCGTSTSVSASSGPSGSIGAIDDIEYYGVVAYTQTTSSRCWIAAPTIVMNYVTSAPESWTIPDFCTGGPCLSQNA
jgi:hypothetical protein